MKTALIISLFVLACFVSSTVIATTYYVNDTMANDDYNGLYQEPGTFPDGPKRTIQAGIDVSTDNDTVIVADGTYTGTGNKNLDFGGKVITLRSRNGPDVTLIDCEGSGRGFEFCSGESSEAVVDGFAITGGDVYGFGGGVSCDYFSNPTIRNCVITNCWAICGGAIHISSDSNPIIINCTMTANNVSGSGGGISGSNVQIVDCTISNNSSSHTNGGGIYGDGFTLINCMISGNRTRGSGGAVYSGDLTLINCTVMGNRASANAPGIYCRKGIFVVTNCTIIDNILARTNVLPSSTGGGIASYSGTGSISNCIIRGNRPSQVYPSDLSLDYCNVKGGWPGSGTGNIDVEPMLTVDGHLMAGSPCIDRSPIGPAYDTDNEDRPHPPAGSWDIGADEFIDTDGDGLPDWWELAHFGSETGAGAGADDDTDDLTNIGEYEKSTDPNIADADDDGRGDGQEVTEETNPHHPDNSEKTYYVNGSIGDDTYDGMTATWDGTHGPKKKIRAGIEATITGWGYVVQVANGIYTGSGNKDLDLGGREITVRSETFAENCIINCENSGRGFTIKSVEGPDTIIQGFTIRNGNPSDYWPWGGAIRFWDSSPTIKDCIIVDNISERGGGIYSYDKGSPKIINCVISGNASSQQGGGIYCSGSSNSTTIINCTITSNCSGWGGGIYSSHNNETKIAGCNISDNTASNGGGGAYLSLGIDSIMTNSVIAGNNSSGIYVSYNSDLDIINCTIVKNSDGIHCDGSDPRITNCILVCNPGGEVYGGSPTLNYCDVQGGWTGSGGNNIDEDPLFVDADNDDFHLLPLSPCVDAGNLASDYSNEPEPNGCRINMGAYGNTLEATPSPGDVDGDLNIDIDDLILVYNTLGSGVYDPALDIDGDGMVTFADLRIVHRHMCPSEQYVGGISTLWVLDYMEPTDPSAEGLNPYEDQSQMDNDGDGKTNYEEYIAGTDPTDASSLFGITEIDFMTTLYLDSISISWSAVPDKNYCLYYSETLGEGAEWIPAGGYYEVINGIATHVLDVGGDAKMKFFKVKVW